MLGHTHRTRTRDWNTLRQILSLDILNEFSTEIADLLINGIR